MLFRSRSKNGPDQTARVIPGVALERDFALVLRRERDRADRTHDVFTLVTLDMAEPQISDAEWCQILGRVVRARLRSTDEAGWLPNSRLGIVLPHTPESGAWTLVGALGERLERQARRHFPLRFAVYSYTGSGGSDGNNGNGNGKTPRHGNGRQTGLQLSTAVHRNGSAPELEALLLEPPGLAKRVLDVALASVGLVLASPVMALAAVAIKCTSRGPVLFRQERAGYGGRPFTFYKLRTMIDGAERIKDELADRNEVEGPIFKMARDPRVTLVGRFLRKTSIDELPQLWNVLRGDMSMVGPRPPTLDEIPKYESWQRRRLCGMGGLTCFWQVCGRSNIGFLDWMRLDLRYLRKRTLGLDLLLILRTIPAVLAGRGAK